MDDFIGVFPDHIINTIKAIPIPISNIAAKIQWKCINDSNFSVKTATWANNYSIRPHTKAKILNNIWKLNLTPKKNYLLGSFFALLFLLEIN